MRLSLFTRYGVLVLLPSARHERNAAKGGEQHAPAAREEMEQHEHHQAVAGERLGGRGDAKGVVPSSLELVLN